MKKRMAFIVMLLTLVGSQVALADSGVVNAASLRVRQKPSVLSSVTGYIPKNTKINTLGKEGNFYKISYNGKPGYLSTSYVNIIKSVSATKIVPIIKSATTISKPMVSAKTTSIEKYGVITAASLNARSGAGSNYPVTGVITGGSKVTLYDKTNGFYKIIYLEKTSYISALYVKITGEKTVSTNSTSSVPIAKPTPSPITELKSIGVGTVTATDFLSVRKAASLSNDVLVLGITLPNQKVDIYGLEGEFYKIKYAGQWGYIYKSYVSLANDQICKAQYVVNGQQYDTNTTGENLVCFSNKFLGMPYLWGGATPAIFNTIGKYISGGFDCSGLVQYSYKNFGINLPRTTMDQVDKGAAVKLNNLENGDLVFFATNTSAPSQVSHVGMYIGDNKFMHSPKPGDVVKISELTGYYIQKFVIGKRIIS